MIESRNPTIESSAAIPNDLERSEFGGVSQKTRQSRTSFRQKKQSHAVVVELVGQPTLNGRQHSGDAGFKSSQLKLGENVEYPY